MSTSTFRSHHATAGTADAAATTKDTTAPPTWHGVLRHPTLTTTVPKEFVHRASVAEVMLTDWARTDDSHFTVAAQWPRGHSFFTTVEGCHDPLIAAETIRQAGSLLAHAEFGVPLGYNFLMWELGFAVHPERLRVESTPATLDIEVACSDIKRRGANLAGLRYEAVVRRDGHTVATGGASFTCTSPRVYERLRAERLGRGRPQPPLTAPTAPQTVGRVSPMDVVLSPTGEQGRWQLRVDTRHPVLFEHPVDHVPGMMLLEAARQATAATLGSPTLPLSVTSTFARYAELDASCMIEARRLPGSGTDREESVLVTAHQEGEPVFRATVTAAAPRTM
ncbi:ScbA/BarX family gamma-butyrolactone biosynthesis protein [Streptomyces sp. NPDC048350]|uniref:ScbA/BarX family gamma-butyrolactone biosynthesis protein n=1 Tax=Streptomyces sp. NPDC048350 TaxID=3365538 RepID=UPI00372310B1